jgi:hypothetical protein
MQIPKEQLIEMLRSRGDHEAADRLNLELPALVDPAEHPELAGLGFDTDAGDADRHEEPGSAGDLSGLPTDLR